MRPVVAVGWRMRTVRLAELLCVGLLAAFAAGCGRAITAREARDWSEPAPRSGGTPTMAPNMVRDLALEAVSLPQPRRQLVEVALAMTGSPATGLDCSSFAVQVYGSVGAELPRTVVSQLRAGRPVDASALQPGDLVFFAFDHAPADHVGIYVGRGAFTHVSSTNRQVRLEALDAPQFARAQVGLRRFVD